MNPESHIGEQHGIYTITDVMPYKDKDGKYLYKGICNECGYERISTIGRFKNENVTKCTHFQKLNQLQINAWYEKNKKQCLYCGKDIPLGNMNFSEYKTRKFCSHSCAASYNNPYIKHENIKNDINYCLNCGKEIKKKNKYCSTKCQMEYQQKEWEKKWLAGEVDGNTDSIWVEARDRVKTYLMRIYDNKCAICGWGEVNPYTGKIPLEVEHIDGNPYRTTPDNVTLLCPNCHSLTSTYRGANKGSGRKKTWRPIPFEFDEENVVT